VSMPMKEAAAAGLKAMPRLQRTTEATELN